MIYLLLFSILICIAVFTYFITRNSEKFAPFETLINGNKEFMRKFGSEGIRYIETQKPHTAILSCSDSRVPVELIFNVKKGELFIVREAGEIPNCNSIASLEYAIAVLGIENLIVLGHSECGAVKASIENKEMPSVYLQTLTDDIRLNIGLETDLNKAIKLNATSILENLKLKSDIINDAILSNKIKAKAGIYNIQNGMIEIFN